jgi:hypothetical protein
MESSPKAVTAGAVLNELSAPNPVTEVAASVTVNNPVTDTLPVPKRPIFDNAEQPSFMMAEPLNEGGSTDMDGKI